ncbi:glucodextranase DOMON-like domain-containing protein [Nonomuraea cavernae]|uniref:Glucan 1,4-alpha-glucosidase n=1 Tax=Nonomuraea cavernae TaxID=2045107 RepID=A0A918DHP7_9ACTN|nr:glucodextranase DOMON-like domain-containing protein [Nonomuraea cavernae]MCA2185560.1 glycoside hydrolase family 15 protein [Nonomuraea cavernae]GGO66837.1 glucan 1,4-alpha-glucosidase [Nonomuraea cavernae]
MPTARTVRTVRSIRRSALALAVVASLVTVPAVPAAAGGPAPGGPGAASHFGLARKDCVGTATGRASKVWYTVAGGVLSDVYEPTIDNTNVETMQFVVTDGRTFTELQARDTTYQVATDSSGMTCTVTSSSRNGRYRLTTTYVTDPAGDAVVVRTRLQPAGLRLYVRLDASVNGNGGGGPANGGADSGVVDGHTGAPVISDTNTETSAPARDYAVPTHLALRAERRLPEASVGYASTPSDGAVRLDADRALAPYTSAPGGNVVATARLPIDARGEVTFALGFGRTAAGALRTAGDAAARPFEATRGRYEAGWAAYDAGLRRPPAALAGRYRLSANVLKASEDKTFPGAVVASLASPWGQAVGAGTEVGGKAVYFGSYREIFARDLYAAFTGFLAAGDLETARATVRFLLERQQLPDGRLPRNSLLNGRLAPDSGGDQLDETAYPLLMAYQAGLAGDAGLWESVRAAADFLVAHGPEFGVERWEEQSGHSPSTIAAEIAGLVAAGEIADRQGDQGRARLYRATADHFARSVKTWTVTTTGPYGPRYFLRLSRAGDPDAAVSYNLGNGAPAEDQRRVVDAGFLELTRLGVLPPTDPDVLASLAVVDRVIRRTTPNGPGWYRYGSDTAGTEDGYGDCHEPDPTSCAPSGAPWPTTNTGSGHLWPVLSGERAEHALQTGDTGTATSLLTAMHAMSSGTGLIPEQAWENPGLPASPYGSDPATASIGLRAGEPAGSASPLTWAQAQELRLILSLGAGRPVEQPEVVRRRYADHGLPPAAALAVTAPADGAAITGASVTVQGTTTPGARVDIAAAPVDTGAPAQVVSVRAGSGGGFTAEAPVSFGEVVLTVTASAGGRTAYDQRTVVGDIVGATTVLDVADPDGDDDGPGTYAYPTAADFRPGAFDLRRFQVITDASTVYLRAEVRDLTPTFGNQMGAQLLDVYAQDPAVAARSTDPAFPQRNHRIAEQDAWTQRVEAQGFAAPVWVTAAGAAQAGAAVRSSGTARTITVALPRATFGTPGPGWRFAVVLTGQDGFSADQARGFGATPEPYRFGVCAPGGTAPLCSYDPGAVPKALDVIIPPGQSQADLLNPLLGPVTLRAVTVS